MDKDAFRFSDQSNMCFSRYKMIRKPFNLQKLPLDQREELPWGDFGTLSFSSLANLSGLTGMMRASPKADLFLISWLMKEAQFSNEIEGTVTTFEEVMGENAGIVAPVERKDDIQEVLNYHEAMNYGLDEIKNGRPFSVSLIKSLHALLLRGARGEHKTPGAWRTVQVHIGKPGSSLEQASYVPPDPLFIEELIENWELFARREDLHPIIQTAVLHAQFEMIHPFLDGNGRMGRLLITLFLASKRILHTPCFYISAYLQRHRGAYYASLAQISRNNDWNPWISFFLNAVVEHTKANASLLMKMTDLYEISKTQFAEATNSSLAVELLDYLFAQPIFTVPNLINQTKVKASKATLLLAAQKLEKAGLVTKISEGRGRRPTVWKFGALVDLIQD